MLDMLDEPWSVVVQAGAAERVNAKNDGHRYGD